MEAIRDAQPPGQGKGDRQNPHQHLTNLLTYFMHPIKNATSDGFNSRIQAIKADARGFRRFGNYRTRILFHCGKLNLLPELPASASH